ncbi:DUF4435 domain-containing protein [Cupriavidus basilensis]
MNTTPEELSKKKNALAVSILKFNKFRGKLPDKKFMVVEGNEDPIFYSAIFRRLEVKNCEIFFIANGKDNVLGLRDHIGRSKEIPKGGGVLYFVDKDFDGLKGWAPGGDIYMTPTYSIENIAVCKVALRHLLLTQFKLADVEMFDDVERVLHHFDELLDQHRAALKEANRIIHFVRQKSLSGEKYTAGSINETSGKFAEIDQMNLSVKQVATGKVLLDLISVCKTIDEASLKSIEEDFESLDSTREWRGKFLFYLFRRFVSMLGEDRNAKVPRFFSKGGGKISLDTSSNSFIGVLASLCEIPDCLRDFMRNAEGTAT